MYSTHLYNFYLCPLGKITRNQMIKSGFYHSKNILGQVVLMSMISDDFIQLITIS